MPKRKIHLLLAACLVGSLTGLTACGQEAKKPSAAAEANSAQVTIVTNSSWKLSKEHLQAAEKATGQKITLVNGEEAGTLDSKLILRKDAPLGELAVGLTMNNIRKVAQAGVLKETKTEVPKSGKEFLLSEAPGAVPIDRSDVCLNYDKEYFTTHKLPVPQSYDDLIKPAYRGLTVMIRPEKSDTGLGIMLATIQKYGEKDFAQYWQKLAQNGTKFSSSWDEAYNQEFSQGEGKGKYPIVASYSSSPFWSVNEAGTDAPTANLPQTCYPVVEYAAVLKGAKNEAGAQKVLHWLLSAEGQRANMVDNVTYPIDQSVTLDPKLAKFAPRPANHNFLPPEQVDQQRKNWIKQVQAATEATG